MLAEWIRLQKWRCQKNLVKKKEPVFILGNSGQKIVDLNTRNLKDLPGTTLKYKRNLKNKKLMVSDENYPQAKWKSDAWLIPTWTWKGYSCIQLEY